MIDGDPEENPFSFDDEDEHYDPVEFDPEDTFVDDDVDADVLALRDAMRDIWASEGQFQILVP
jgi:hypothetical protein